MTITGFVVNVPDPECASEWFRRLAGVRAASLVHFRRTPSGEHGVATMPRVIDTGCSHFCLRVGDIDSASGYLRDQGVDVLGRPMFIDSGPLENFYWQYFRSPWGGFFEVQQWAPGPYSEGVAQLATYPDHDPTASIPTVFGLDHVGLVVTDLEAAVSALESVGGHRVLGSVAAGDRTFMTEQFDLVAVDTLRMTMVRVGDINLELFQHDVDDVAGAPQRRAPMASGDPGATSLQLSPPPPEDIEELLRSLGLTVELDVSAR